MHKRCTNVKLFLIMCGGCISVRSTCEYIHLCLLCVGSVNLCSNTVWNDVSSVGDGLLWGYWEIVSFSVSVWVCGDGDKLYVGWVSSWVGVYVGGCIDVWVRSDGWEVWKEEGKGGELRSGVAKKRRERIKYCERQRRMSGNIGAGTMRTQRDALSCNDALPCNDVNIHFTKISKAQWLPCLIHTSGIFTSCLIPFAMKKKYIYNSGLRFFILWLWRFPQISFIKRHHWSRLLGAFLKYWNSTLKTQP